MTSNDKNRQSDWNSFDALFELPEHERVKAWSQENLAFLQNFVVREMNHYNLPDIDNAQDFSEIIKVLRLNYRQWNQRLMKLMWINDELRSTEAQNDLAEFINSCPWNMLIDVARDVPGQLN
ncbi:hypothetical protein ACO0LL_25605 [Undibacterium sp. TC4M20W]|uniref:hypothetical protein n=1 Tax=Undibacterium sp. TC4M20W TaxID=3413052 RepID=UPI003BEFFBFC